MPIEVADTDNEDKEEEAVFADAVFVARKSVLHFGKRAQMRNLCCYNNLHNKQAIRHLQMCCDTVHVFHNSRAIESLHEKQRGITKIES